MPTDGIVVFSRFEKRAPKMIAPGWPLLAQRSELGKKTPRPAATSGFDGPATRINAPSIFSNRGSSRCCGMHRSCIFCRIVGSG